MPVDPQLIIPTFLSPGWPPPASSNGIVTYTARMSQAIQSIGGRSNIIALQGDAFGTNAVLVRPRGVTLSRITNRIRRAMGHSNQYVDPKLLGLRYMIRRLKKRQATCVFQMEESFGWSQHIVGRTGIPTIVRLHGPWFLTGAAAGADMDTPKNRNRIIAEGKGILAADGLTAPSIEVLEKTREYYKSLLPNAKVIPNPLPKVPDAELWKSSHSERNSILFVGRFDKAKGADLMLDAFEILARKRPELKLYFCGPDEGLASSTGRLLNFTDYIKDTISDRAVRRRILYLGHQPPREITKLRQTAAVSVMASRWESFSNVTLEAMSLGCPTVATDCGGPREIIDDGSNGLLATPNDSAALAKQIERLLCNRALAAQLGSKAAQSAKRRFSPESVARQSLEFYGRILRIGRWKLRTTA